MGIVRRTARRRFLEVLPSSKLCTKECPEEHLLEVPLNKELPVEDPDLLEDIGDFLTRHEHNLTDVLPKGNIFENMLVDETVTNDLFTNNALNSEPAASDDIATTKDVSTSVNVADIGIEREQSYEELLENLLTSATPDELILKLSITNEIPDDYSNDNQSERWKRKQDSDIAGNQSQSKKFKSCEGDERSFLVGVSGPGEEDADVIEATFVETSNHEDVIHVKVADNVVATVGTPNDTDEDSQLIENASFDILESVIDSGEEISGDTLESIIEGEVDDPVETLVSDKEVSTNTLKSIKEGEVDDPVESSEYEEEVSSETLESVEDALKRVLLKPLEVEVRRGLELDTGLEVMLSYRGLEDCGRRHLFSKMAGRGDEGGEVVRLNKKAKRGTRGWSHKVSKNCFEEGKCLASCAGNEDQDKEIEQEPYYGRTGDERRKEEEGRRERVREGKRGAFSPPLLGRLLAAKIRPVKSLSGVNSERKKPLELTMLSDHKSGREELSQNISVSQDISEISGGLVLDTFDNFATSEVNEDSLVLDMPVFDWC